MKKFTILLAVLILGVVSTTSAQIPAKPFNIYGAVGLSSPMSPDSFKDGVKMGFHGDAQLGFSTMPKGEFLINLGYHKFGGDNDSLSDFSMILAGGDFKFNLSVPAAPVKPFLLAGVGLAVISMSDVTIPTGPLAGSYSFDSVNKFYFKVGGGIEFTKYFVRVQYVSVATDGESSAFIPLSVGFKF